jgi:hypothetical protein
MAKRAKMRVSPYGSMGDGSSSARQPQQRRRRGAASPNGAKEGSKMDLKNFIIVGHIGVAVVTGLFFAHTVSGAWGWILQLGPIGNWFASFALIVGLCFTATTNLFHVGAAFEKKPTSGGKT